MSAGAFAGRAGVRRLRASVFARNVAGTLAARVAAMALALASTLVVARVLGPAGRGEYAVAAVLTGTGVQIASLGLHASNTYHAGRDPALAPALFANSLRAAFGAGGAAAAAALAFFALWPGAAPLAGWPLALALAAIPFALAYLLLGSLLLGLQEVGAHNRIEVASGAAGAGLVVAAAAAGVASVPVLLACTLAGAVAGLAGAAAALRRRVAPGRASAQVFRTTLRYGSRAYLGSLLVYLAQRADVFILAEMAGAVPTGHYAAASSVAALAMLPATVAGTVLFPRVAALPDPRERWRLSRGVAAAVGVGMVGVCAACAAAAPLAIRVLFGADFLPAVAPLRTLLPGVFLLSVNGILMNYFAGTGMPRVTVYAPAAALAASVALSLALVPRWGAVGAAAAWSAGCAALLAASVGYLAFTPSARGA